MFLIVLDFPIFTFFCHGDLFTDSSIASIIIHYMIIQFSFMVYVAFIPVHITASNSLSFCVHVYYLQAETLSVTVDFCNNEFATNLLGLVYLRKLGAPGLKDATFTTNPQNLVLMMNEL